MRQPRRRAIGAACAVAWLALAPAGSTGAAPPEEGRAAVASAASALPEDGRVAVAPAASAPRMCLADARRSASASRLECQLELAPRRLQLSVLYGSERWSRGGASGWQDPIQELLSPSAFGLGASPGGPPAWQQDLEARMRLEGRLRGLRYRAEYGFFQDAHHDRAMRLPSARAGGRFESSWSLGFLQPKLELSHFQRQRPDPGEDAETRSRARFALDVRLPSLPVLTLAVGRETRRVESPTSRFDRSESEEVLTDSASASLWYGRSSWEASFTSSFFQVEQNLDDGSDAVLHDHILSLTYRPTDALSLVPFLEYTRTLYPGSDYATTSTLASLGVYHTSFGGKLNSYLYASYLADSDSLGYLDTRSIDLAAGLEQDVSGLLGLSHGTQTLGLELTVGRYEDLVYREASTSTYGAFLRIRIRP